MDLSNKSSFATSYASVTPRLTLTLMRYKNNPETLDLYLLDVTIILMFPLPLLVFTFNFRVFIESFGLPNKELQKVKAIYSLV